MSSTQPPTARPPAPDGPPPVPARRSTPPPPRPLDPPMVPFAIGGIVIWAALGLALLPFRDRLAEAGNTDWLWTCLAGFLVGFPGLFVMIRHDAARRRRRSTDDPRG